MGRLFRFCRRGLATNGFRASAGEHSVKNGHPDRSFSPLRKE
jgi:hypothetical protein